MEEVEVNFTDFSNNPSPNVPQPHLPSSNNTRTGKYNINSNEEKSSCFQSMGKKRLLIIALVAIVTIIVIVLVVVLSVVLTRKSNPSESTSQSQSNTSIPLSARQRFLTKCQPAKSDGLPKTVPQSTTKSERQKVKMPPISENLPDRVLLKDTYLVEFASDSVVTDHFRAVTKSLKATHNIQPSGVKKRCDIRSSLFSGVSFTINDKHSIEAIEMIKDAVAVYPVYIVQVPQPIKRANPLYGSGTDYFRSYNLTGVTQVHERFQNFGKGVRVAVIDTGVYYLHPALGGCFGNGCKVEFGYDFLGDSFNGSDATLNPDNDPLDNCSYSSHGTHVAGIIAANTTGINETRYIPAMPFIGVAPQVTLGAYRVLGCSGSGPTDAITNAILRAYEDKADIINLSLGSSASYPESPDSIAVQRVIEKGVYVVVAAGNSGDGGLQTSLSPGTSKDAMAVASIDNTYTLTAYTIFTPNGSKIFYIAGVSFGGWKSTINAVIVVNNPSATINDGCLPPSKVVKGAVVLFYVDSEDQCNSTTRCDQAAAAGAIGCLLYNSDEDIGSTVIPSGIISLADGLSIIRTINENPFAIYTFTDIIQPTAVETAGTLSYFSSFGLSADLLFKPQISGIGGNIYSTISPYAAQEQKLSKMYGMSSGTSMACPFVAGTMALFLGSIGNPAPSTVNGDAPNGICRPKFSLARDIFQSTAKLVNIYDSSLLNTAAQQGSGLVDAFQALNSTTLISPSQLSLNDTVRKATSYKFQVVNIGDQVAIYNMTHRGAALATGKNASDDQLLNTPLFSPDYATVVIEPITFEVEPQQSREVTVRFEAPTNADPNLLPIYSGFIDARNQVNGEVVHLSYAGVVGDYTKAQIIVRNSPSGFVTGVLDVNYVFISEQQLPSLNVTNGLIFIMILAWPTRLVLGEVISTGNNGASGFNASYGLLRSGDSEATLYLANQPRNVASAHVQYYSQYILHVWYGHVCPNIMNTTCSNAQTIRLPPGVYRIRLSALKHFGNISNPVDFDVYDTPAFNLIY